ncbi:unnamed protein product [Rotaria sordida]|uniref:Calmodulin-binding domain-containing protein n=1 Tax=Rotaria sordida TaxID=392033 RepID=A0A814J1R1_9BILA|nr:unnamed protein product [Rotaria sordida]
MESSTQVPTLPTTIVMPSDTSSSSSSTQSSKKKDLAENQTELPYVSHRKQALVKEISISYLKHRLCLREHFYARLTLVSNLMSSLAIVGIILMIIENELTFARVNKEDTKVSWSLKLIITITTVILLALIFYYHYLDMNLYSYRNMLEDWRIELTNRKILLIILEISICAVHPIPRSYPQSNSEKINLTSIQSDSSSPNPYSLSYTAVDVGLGLPSIATIVGLIGLLLSAILIAILTQKLLLTRKQKYVHTFVLNTRLEKKRKNQAANIIKFAIKVWYLKRRNKSTSIEYFLTQRKVFQSIHHLQKIRQDQRNLIDICVDLTDLMTIHRDTSVQTRETVGQIVAIKTDIKKIEEELKNINYCMNTLQNTLNVLLDRATK